MAVAAPFQQMFLAEAPLPPAQLIDDLGSSCFVDDLGVTSWVDDTGRTLSC